MKIKSKSPKQIKLTLKIETRYDLTVLEMLLNKVVPCGDIDVQELRDELLTKVKELQQ